MIITPKQPKNDKTRSRLSKLVPYMLRGQGKERCTWYMAGNLPGLDRREDAGLAVDVMELLQAGNQRAKGNKTYHLVISFHPEDRRLTPAELEDVVRRSVRAAGLEEHQYIAVRHSEQEHEHLHVAVNKIHPETLKIHHPYKVIHAYQALSTILEEELGLHRVDRIRRPSHSHKARNFEAHQGLESFSRWSRRSIGDATELDRIASWDGLHRELKRFGVCSSESIRPGFHLLNPPPWMPPRRHHVRNYDTDTARPCRIRPVAKPERIGRTLLLATINPKCSLGGETRLDLRQDLLDAKRTANLAGWIFFERL